jgi:exosortase/archaeosortase family protein
MDGCPAFPIAFLIFMVPLPDRAVDWLETAYKLASTDAAHLFFLVSGTPVLRDGTVFQLPGIVFEVGQECSGIRSSLALFLTSMVASHLLLKTPCRRIVLVALVIPLGILRNGLRILVIGLLCVHLGPNMIHSIVHKQGGPAFFLLSLLPLFLLLWWLGNCERSRSSGDRLKITQALVNKLRLRVLCWLLRLRCSGASWALRRSLASRALLRPGVSLPECKRWRLKAFWMVSA